MTDTPEARHWLWTAIAAGLKVHAVRELHRSEMYGGLATGKCKECGKSYPCPTAQAVAREPDGPCACGPDCPKNAGMLAASGEQPGPRSET
jgi:hypothetical protein